MRIGPQALQTIAFVGVDTQHGGFQPCGTGFLVLVERGDWSFSFLMTARHVLDEISSSIISLRVNDKAERCEQLCVEKVNIQYHPDKDADLALLPIRLDPAKFAARAMRLNRNHIVGLRATGATPEIGHQVAIIGLYTSHYGESKNVPIVRSGNIAMLPDEPVRTRSGFIKAYLVETRSIGGLSGSPVFLTPPDLCMSDGQIVVYPKPHYSVMGMLLGHHMIGYTKDQIPVPDFQSSQPILEQLAPSQELINTGISVVLPIEVAIDWVESAEFTGMLDRATDQHFRSTNYVQGASGP